MHIAEKLYLVNIYIYYLLILILINLKNIYINKFK